MAVGDQPSIKRRTMRLNGRVGNQEVLIPVDSGSVATFISEQLANKLQQPIQHCDVATFIAADGSPMSCTRRVPDLCWGTQGHLFSVNPGVLPLQCYDMILGADWLEESSPMWVNWKQKVMKFTHQGTRIKLCGVSNTTTKCSAISLGKLKGMIRRGAITHCIQANSCQHTGSYPESKHTCCDSYSYSAPNTRSGATSLSVHSSFLGTIHSSTCQAL